MNDYNEMYLQLFKLTENAINVLIDAQQKTEESYMELIEMKLNIIKLMDKKM